MSEKEMVEEFKYLTDCKLFQDSKRRKSEKQKIENQYDWISYLSHLDECGQMNDVEQLVRIARHLDTRIIMWALDHYKNYINLCGKRWDKRKRGVS